MVVPETWYFWYSMVQALPDPEGLEGLLGVPDMRSQMLMGPAHREEGVDSRIRVFSTAKGRN